MKKKIVIILAFFILVISLMPGFNAGTPAAYANSAPPSSSEPGSGILFDKHDTVKIDSEVLDIVMDKYYADISAS